ncbi:hypothetical protein AWW66_09125 [Micromonospora rosaria]|uniref:Uncharacterized protein n=1 Tax=Micromonospora rosaria TaxID=47874 RepID=A0A136PV10_9ACTN|nr:DUF6244 family protein [Micromonospora rosaria]KXK62289.1 hypothetical protein AWW66_09125 [Micromonospora rosaria]
MSTVEEITGELHALLAGVERAQGLTAAADNQAQEVAVRAAGTGFTAVAAGIARVRNALATVQAGLTALATSAGEAVKASTTVPRGATPQETIAALAPVQQGVTAAREACIATISHVDEARQLVSAVLQGGQPGPLLQTLDSVKQVLVLLVQRTQSARQAVEATVDRARQLGSSGN